MNETKVLCCALGSLLATVFFGILYMFGPTIVEWSKTIPNDPTIFGIIVFFIFFIVSIVSVILTEWIFDY